MLQLRTSTGFSMAELLMALALSTTLSAIAVPFSIHSIRWVRLRAAAHEFLRELHRGRLQALAQNASIRVTVAVSENQYQLVSAADSSQSQGTAHTLSRGVHFQRLPRRAIVFHPWGTASPAGSYILGSSAGKLRILVHLTGRIRLEDILP